MKVTDYLVNIYHKKITLNQTQMNTEKQRALRDNCVPRSALFIFFYQIEWLYQDNIDSYQVR